MALATFADPQWRLQDFELGEHGVRVYEIGRNYTNFYINIINR